MGGNPQSEKPLLQMHSGLLIFLEGGTSLLQADMSEQKGLPFPEFRTGVFILI